MRLLLILLATGQAWGRELEPDFVSLSTPVIAMSQPADPAMVERVETVLSDSTAAASVPAAPLSEELAVAPLPPAPAEEPAVAASTQAAAVAKSTAPVPIVFPADFKAMRAVHFSAWAAGSSKARQRFLEKMRGTVLNAIVIPVKEIDGQVYIPGVARAKEYGTQRLAIPDPAAMLAEMKAENLYTVARVAVFKDDLLPRKRPEWGIHKDDGSLWTNHKGVAWVDPYQKKIWEYAVDVAARSAELGFDEIQFDYIRFPSDGDTRQCRYSNKEHTAKSAVIALHDFLTYAQERLKPTGVKVSVAIFGMTTTAQDDMGIGQRISSMADGVDFVSPMMYPSHYGKGEYGLANPNKEPYKVINRGLRDAKARLKENAYKLRPYLQDFSLGWHYGPGEVRAQIHAARWQGIESWILWNPGNRYTWEALKALEDAPQEQAANN